MLEVLIIAMGALVLAVPLSRYMVTLFDGRPHRLDKGFVPIEQGIYRLLGVDPQSGMTWRSYGCAFMVSNLLLGMLVFGLLKCQQWLPLNPDNIGPLSWDLALHTTISFLTNTNQQHYAGQAQLSYFSQGVLIVTLQFVTPAMALAVCVAMLRGLGGGRNPHASEGQARDLGNYYVDLVRIIVRLLLPLSVLLALLLTVQGVPSTFQGAQTIQALDTENGVTTQSIPRGPVAAMVAIKQLGSNGGGWFGPNSAHPLENPTGISNALETIAIILLPMAIVLMAGELLGRRRFAWMSLGTMLLLSGIMTATMMYSEAQPNSAFTGLATDGANMEGKEQRFGPELSALWAALTTQTSNGSVNAMLDSFNPIGALMARSGMLLNAIWGGVGCGFINFMVYVWLTVFLCGLMIGRTPEIFGRKLETREISLLGILVVLPALGILGLTAITLAFPSLTGNSNPGLHGISQVFYEYTSAFANNGSGFEGLNDNSPWWNLSCTVLLLLGRYLPILLPLAIAGSLAAKRVSPPTSASLSLESATFAITLIVVMLLLNFLSFLPATVLGPIGEALSLLPVAGA